ncbi:hypothetical protein RND81_01G082700 [Saponaria officinalis]|uniref:Uncharacterized protein n=1 Tax=Saponaria officinalis TaxID=3572 RepID=A0AAW1NCZ8_SAPOF
MSKLQQDIAKLQLDAMAEHYEAELQIKEFPRPTECSVEVTHMATLGSISEWTCVAITSSGEFFPPGRIPAPGEHKFYLFVEGHSEHLVKTVKDKLTSVLFAGRITTL